MKIVFVFALLLSSIPAMAQSAVGVEDLKGLQQRSNVNELQYAGAQTRNREVDPRQRTGCFVSYRSSAALILRALRGLSFTIATELAPPECIVDINLCSRPAPHRTHRSCVCGRRQARSASIERCRPRHDKR